MDSRDIELVKKLVPFNSMSDNDLDDALQKAAITMYNEGKMVFKRNEEDTNAHWLLAGSIDLLDEKFEAKNRKAGDEAARFPFDNNTPHRVTAITTEEAKILTAPRDIARRASAAKSPDIDDSEAQGVDWMSTLLSSPLFRFIQAGGPCPRFRRGRFSGNRSFLHSDLLVVTLVIGSYIYMLVVGRLSFLLDGGPNIFFFVN